MLKKILPLLGIGIALMGFSSTAVAVLFQAAEANSEEFQKYALRKNQQTYTQWTYENTIKKDIEAHSQVLEFSQHILKEGSLKQALSDWSLLLRSIDLNQADREIFSLLAEKLQWRKELCRYVLLDPELAPILESSSLVQKCQQQALPLPQFFLKQLLPEDSLVIDGKVFTPHFPPPRLMAGEYQWRIISNQQEDRRFVGTAEEFSKQKWTRQNWVKGDCKDYKFTPQDFTLLLQSQVYFNETCINPAVPPEKNFYNWSAEHKPLLWGVSILITGLIASQLKDKTLVLTRP
ncbi:MAG: hypothetical protein ACXVB4_15975 [Pseudobdellovibrionaceae bacterium]